MTQVRHACSLRNPVVRGFHGIPLGLAGFTVTVPSSPACHHAGRPSKRPIGDIEERLCLTAGSRQVQRPVGEGSTGLDQLGDGDVEDTLAACLRPGDAGDHALLRARALPLGAGELVRVVTPRLWGRGATSFLGNSACPRVVHAGRTVTSSALFARSAPPLALSQFPAVLGRSHGIGPSLPR